MMRVARIAMVMLLWLCTLLPVRLSHAQDLGDHESVSLINLIATPDRYDSKKVAVAGWITLKFENMSLCLASVVPSSKECIWVEIEDSSGSSSQPPARITDKVNAWSSMSGKRVVVHGTFDKANTGHFGGWSGAVGRIVRITPTEQPKPEKGPR